LSETLPEVDPEVDDEDEIDEATAASAVPTAAAVVVGAWDVVKDVVGS
jgi:hypothetical protein